MIEWHEYILRVDVLKPYERNPRRITKKQYDRLKKAIAEVGFHTPLLATHDFKLIAGHQRIRALKELGITEVAVRVPTRPLTPAEFDQVLIQSNVHMGEFDIDILAADFSPSILIEWGIPDKLFDLAPDGPDMIKDASDNGADKKFPDDEKANKLKHHTCPSCGFGFEG